MSVLSFDKPARARSPEEHADMHSSDTGIPGTYAPNMSDSDMKRWKAKKIADRVEIRKTVSDLGSYAQVKIIVTRDNVLMSANGRMAWNNEDWDNLGQAVAEAREILRKSHRLPSEDTMGLDIPETPLQAYQIGREYRPSIVRNSYFQGTRQACPIGAIAISLDQNAAELQPGNVMSLVWGVYPELLSLTTCPACGKDAIDPEEWHLPPYNGARSNIIIHLNDWHHYTDEQMTEYLGSIR